MYHKVILVGRLGRDPEMRYTQEGTPVTNFSLATNEKWTGADGQPQERTIWWRVACWRRLAETTNEYLSKGRQVLVEARMNPDRETGNPRIFTRNDGTVGASYEVTAITVKFLGSRGDYEEASESADDSGEEATDIDGEEIPF